MTTVSTKMPRSPKKPKKMYTEPTSEAVIEQLRKDYRKRVKQVFKKDPPKKKKSRLNSSKYMNHHKLNGPTPIPPVATTTVTTFKPIRIRARGKLYSKQPSIRFLEPDTVS